MAMFRGRLSREEIEEHFDHIGWYFFVPVYLSLGPGFDFDGDGSDDDEQEGAGVAVRNGYPEWLMDAADAIFSIAVIVRQLVDPDYEPMFPFKVTGRIVKSKH